MIKAQTVLEIKIQDRTYQFLCSPDSPLGELHDVLSRMNAFIVEKINEAMPKNEEENKAQSRCA